MPENEIGYFFVVIKRQGGPRFVYTCAFGNVFVYTFFPLCQDVVPETG